MDEHDATTGERVESKLVFESDHYRDEESYERIAEGYKKRGDRRIIYGYDLDHTRPFPLLRVHALYYQKTDERGHTTRTYRVEDGVVERTDQELTAFIEDDFDDREFDAEFEGIDEGM